MPSRSGATDRIRLWAALVVVLGAMGCGDGALGAPRAADREVARRAASVDVASEPAVAPEEIAAEEIAATLVVTPPAPAERLATLAMAPARVEVAELIVPAGGVEPRGSFFAHADAPIVASLASQSVVEVDRGEGGRSLSFKITLADGTRGNFKPEQSFNGMQWHSEIAAYHLDRELGLGRVAPVVGRRVAWSELREAAGGDGRIDELRVGEDGTLRGALVWWVPARPTPLPLEPGWERWLRIEGEPDAVTPFQRPNQVRDRQVIARPAEAPEPDTAERPAELSDLIVFDYLIQNLDRWGGNNTNVRTLGPGGPLMFLDNAAGFVLRRPRVALMDSRLAHVQRFRRSTIEAVRELDVERLQARMAEDPLAPALDARQVANLEERRAHLLAHVDALVEDHGEDAVYAW